MSEITRQIETYEQISSVLLVIGILLFAVAVILFFRFGIFRALFKTKKHDTSKTKGTTKTYEYEYDSGELSGVGSYDEHDEDPSAEDLEKLKHNTVQTTEADGEIVVRHDDDHNDQVVTVNTKKAGADFGKDLIEKAKRTSVSVPAKEKNGTLTTNQSDYSVEQEEETGILNEPKGENARKAAQNIVGTEKYAEAETDVLRSVQDETGVLNEADDETGLLRDARDETGLLDRDRNGDDTQPSKSKNRGKFVVVNKDIIFHTEEEER